MPIDGGGAAGPESSAGSAPPVSCDFGPFGEQTRVNLNTLRSQKLGKITLLVHHSFADAVNIIFLPSLIDSAIVCFTHSSVFAGKPCPCVQRRRVRLGC